MRRFFSLIQRPLGNIPRCGDVLFLINDLIYKLCVNVTHLYPYKGLRKG